MKRHQTSSLKNHKLLILLVSGIILFLTFSVAATQSFPNTTYPVPTPLPQKEKVIVVSSPPTSTSSPIVTASPSAKVAVKEALKLPKPTYSIALIGDSMVETMGENTDYLQKSLSAKYPTTQFKLYNYGIGGQNIEQGLNRFSLPFNYKTRNYPPLPEIHPDILIVGSFSYNPFADHDRTKHSRLLREMINQARGASGRVYLIAEIAPLKTGFGKGVGGINWLEDKAATQALHIIEQLDNAVTLAKTENVPLINAFQSSKTEGNYGNPAYVAPHDGIHPSIAGHVFMANLIAALLAF